MKENAFPLRARLRRSDGARNDVFENGGIFTVVSSDKRDDLSGEGRSCVNHRQKNPVDLQNGVHSFTNFADRTDELFQPLRRKEFRLRGNDTAQSALSVSIPRDGIQSMRIKSY